MEMAEIELRTGFLFAGKSLSSEQKKEIVTELHHRVKRQEASEALSKEDVPEVKVEDGRRTLAVA